MTGFTVKVPDRWIELEFKQVLIQRTDAQIDQLAKLFNDNGMGTPGKNVRSIDKVRGPLKQEVVDWLMEDNTSYSYITGEITFDNEQDAIKFKLRWL